MKIHRFIGPFDLTQKDLQIKDKEIINQMKNVLRLKEGELIELADGKNGSAMAKIKKIEKDSINVSIEKVEKNKNKTKNNVSLFCAVLKKENFELVVQKATECGVSKIIPIITARTIKTGLNMERLQKIAKEASEQSGRITIPEISEPIDFNQALELIKNNFNILFDRSGELLSKMPWERDGASTRNFSAEKYPCVLESNSPRSIFIGPEGGWTEEEITKVKSLNFKIVSLGTLTLRGETAAIIATYLISNL
jgi:16S rRNA (uracil1498-N3)-methyltransferase